MTPPRRRRLAAFTFFWRAHQWVGIVAALVLVVVAGTGFLLLLKKEYAWIQPPTREGAPGGEANFHPLSEILGTVYAHGHDDFRSLADIDRIDFRPHKRVHKVRSKYGTEMQVDAVTGAVLAVAARRSDLIEDIHDGSFFADAWHDYGMPLVAIALAFLAATGVYLWAAPRFRRRRRGPA